MNAARPAIGNRYASADAWQTRWEVVEIVEKPGYPSHVRLRSLRDPADFRLIAVAALLDRARFVPIQDGPSKPSTKG